MKGNIVISQVCGWVDNSGPRNFEQINFFPTCLAEIYAGFAVWAGRCFFVSGYGSCWKTRGRSWLFHGRHICLATASSGVSGWGEAARSSAFVFPSLALGRTRMVRVAFQRWLALFLGDTGNLLWGLFLVTTAAVLVIVLLGGLVIGGDVDKNWDRHVHDNRKQKQVNNKWP